MTRETDTAQDTAAFTPDEYALLQEVAEELGVSVKAVAALGGDSARMDALQSVMTVLRCNPYDDDLYIYIKPPVAVQMSNDLRVFADNLIAAMSQHDPEATP